MLISIYPQDGVWLRVKISVLCRWTLFYEVILLRCARGDARGAWRHVILLGTINPCGREALMCYTLREIRDAVSSVVLEYNSAAPDDARIRSVSLFGSYARGAADDDSDVDLLVSFSSSAVSLFTLARVLEAMEGHLSVSVDLVQEPLPEDALLDVGERVLLYEAA